MSSNSDDVTNTIDKVFPPSISRDFPYENFVSDHIGMLSEAGGLHFFQFNCLDESTGLNCIGVRDESHEIHKFSNNDPNTQNQHFPRARRYTKESVTHYQSNVVALQEVPADQIENLRADFPEAEWNVVIGSDMVTFYRKALQCEQGDDPNTPNPFDNMDQLIKDVLQPAGNTLAFTDIASAGFLPVVLNDNGKPVLVLNHHGSYAQDNRPLQQALLAISRAVKQKYNISDVVVLGDFNRPIFQADAQPRDAATNITYVPYRKESLEAEGYQDYGCPDGTILLQADSSLNVNVNILPTQSPDPLQPSQIVSRAPSEVLPESVRNSRPVLLDPRLHSAIFVEEEEVDEGISAIPRHIRESDRPPLRKRNQEFNALHRLKTALFPQTHLLSPDNQEMTVGRLENYFKFLATDPSLRITVKKVVRSSDVRQLRVFTTNANLEILKSVGVDYDADSKSYLIKLKPQADHAEGLQLSSGRMLRYDSLRTVFRVLVDFSEAKPTIEQLFDGVIEDVPRTIGRLALGYTILPDNLSDDENIEMYLAQKNIIKALPILQHLSKIDFNGQHMNFLAIVENIADAQPVLSELLRQWPFTLAVSEQHTLGEQFIIQNFIHNRASKETIECVLNMVKKVNSHLLILNGCKDFQFTAENILLYAQRCLMMHPILEALKTINLVEKGVKDTGVRQFFVNMYNDILDTTTEIDPKQVDARVLSLRNFKLFMDCFEPKLLAEIVKTRESFITVCDALQDHRGYFDVCKAVGRTIPAFNALIASSVERILAGNVAKEVAFFTEDEDEDEELQQIANLRRLINLLPLYWPENEYAEFNHYVKSIKVEEALHLANLIVTINTLRQKLNTEQAKQDLDYLVGNLVWPNALIRLEHALKNLYLDDDAEQLTEAFYQLDCVQLIIEQRDDQRQRKVLADYAAAFDQAKEHYLQLTHEFDVVAGVKALQGIAAKNTPNSWHEVTPESNFHAGDLAQNTRTSTPGERGYNHSAQIFKALASNERVNAELVSITHQNNAILHYAQAELERLSVSRSSSAAPKLARFLNRLKDGLPKEAIQKLFEHRYAGPHWSKIAKGGMHFLQQFNGARVPLIAIEALMDFIIRDLLDTRALRGFVAAASTVTHAVGDAQSELRRLSKANKARVNKARLIIDAFEHSKQTCRMDDRGFVDIREFYGRREENGTLAHAYQVHQSKLFTSRKTGSTKLNHRMFAALNANALQDLELVEEQEALRHQVSFI